MGARIPVKIWTERVRLRRPMRWANWILRLPCTTSASSKVLENHSRAFFGDHRRRGVRIAGRDRRHDGGIDNPKPVDAVDLQARIDDGFCIRGKSHLGGSDGMEDGGADVAGRPGEGLGVVPDV